MIDQETREVIPGMRVYTDANNNYTMSGLPNGDCEIVLTSYSIHYTKLYDPPTCPGRMYEIPSGLPFPLDDP